MGAYVMLGLVFLIAVIGAPIVSKVEDNETKTETK